MSKRWNNFKDMYNELSDEKNSICSLEQEKKELESNPFVQRYLDILHLLKIQSTISDINLTNHVNEDSKSNVYVFMRSYAISQDDRLYQRYYTVAYGDSREVYREYKNLETDTIKCIDKKDYEIFESSNVILRPIDKTFDSYYNEVQRVYFSELSRNGKEKAREKIKRL